MGSSPRRRARRCVALSSPWSCRARSAAPRAVREARRRRGSAHRAVGGAVPARGPAAAVLRRVEADQGARADRESVRPGVRAAAHPARGRTRGAGISRPRAALEQQGNAPGRGGHCERFSRPRARAVGGHGAGRRAVASRRVPVAAAQPRCTVSTTALPRTSGSWPASSARTSTRARSSSPGSRARWPTHCRWDRAAISRRRARPKSRRIRLRWSARKCA